MPYRPSTAGFELNAGSALSGVLPASMQAALIGSVLTLTGFFGAALIHGELSLAELSIMAIPGLLLLLMFVTIIGTAFCAFYIALVGVPIALAMGRRLETPLGLIAAVGAAVLAGAVAAGIFGAAPPFGESSWLFTLLVFVHALPAGVLYRGAVLTSRSFSPFAEPEIDPAA